MLGSLAALLPPVKLGGSKAKLERAERALRPAVSLLTRRLEEAAKLDSLRSRGAAAYVSAETAESVRLAYGVARELWALPHVLKCNGGQMVRPLVDGLLLRPAPAGCEVRVRGRVRARVHVVSSTRCEAARSEGSARWDSSGWRPRSSAYLLG